MRWIDYTPLFAAILALLIFVGIIGLSVAGRTVPDSLTYAAGAATASFFVTGALRGTEPHDPKGGDDAGK